MGGKRHKMRKECEELDEMSSDTALSDASSHFLTQFRSYHWSIVVPFLIV